MFLTLFPFENSYSTQTFVYVNKLELSKLQKMGPFELESELSRLSHVNPTTEELVPIQSIDIL